MDLRGHGLSDAPTATGAYDIDELAGDVAAVADGSGALESGSVVLAGHGFGAVVAAAAAARLGDRCARLVLVDGGPCQHWRGDRPGRRRVSSGDRGAARGHALDDRLSPGSPLVGSATWDADQEQAARAAVVETPAGRLVSATRPHALEASVRTEFAYRPTAVLPQVTAQIVVVRRTTPGDEDETGVGDLVPPGARVVDVTAPGHNLLRYRPDEVTAAILGG
jgi:pimeloyl-ACP methyl ester carboxylesterase